MLTTNHAYPAVRKALTFLCRGAGATLVEAAVPFPLTGDDQVVAAVEAALGPKTRLAVFDHVTSQTAVVYPVARLIELCRSRNVPVLVDGAHVPGMLPLDLSALGADWYTGNAHKWLFSPKGCGFLWARPEHQPDLHPLVISHGLDQGYLAEFDWVGTRDPSAWLAVTDAIAFHGRLGHQAVMCHNRDLATEAADLLADTWGTDQGAPRAMRGSMATVRLPGGGGDFDECRGAAQEADRRPRRRSPGVVVERRSVGSNFGPDLQHHGRLSTPRRRHREAIGGDHDVDKLRAVP